MSNSIFSSPIVNGVVLGAVTAGVAVFGGDMGKAMKEFIPPGTEGLKGLADQVLEAVGGGLQNASTAITKQGSIMAGAMELDGRVHAAVLPAIAAGGITAAITGLAAAGLSSNPTPGGIPSMTPTGPARQ